MNHILSWPRSRRFGIAFLSVWVGFQSVAGCVGSQHNQQGLDAVVATPLDGMHGVTCVHDYQDPVVDEAYRARIRSVNRALGFPEDQLNGLEAYREGTNLVGSGKQRLTAEASQAFKRMQADAAGRGVNFWIISGYRSLAEQEQIIRGKKAAGQSIDEIRRVNMPVGHSQHHLGTTADLGTPGSTSLTNAFANTRAYRWLGENAWRYGFKAPYVVPGNNGITQESWHWQYVGVAKCYRPDGTQVPTTIELFYGIGQPNPLNSPPLNR